MLWLE